VQGQVVEEIGRLVAIGGIDADNGVLVAGEPLRKNETIVASFSSGFASFQTSGFTSPTSSLPPIARFDDDSRDRDYIFLGHSS